MLFTLFSIISILSLSIQALSNDPRYNVVFKQQSLEPIHLNNDYKQVIMTFENDKFTCLLPNESNEKKQTKKKTSHHYWSYEFCYNKHVRQFHVENSNGELKETISYHLGLYDSNQPIHLDDRKLSQLWPEGTLCDVTGQPRSVEIVYECGKDTLNQEDRLLSFKEVHTCQYEITIATPRLCVHPSQAHNIECFPRL
ncbi:hypothetical protein K501DRAFT_334047 [Backusella circina FSU 941]|nr:hypothetical protein K501DRAFT_334047 [Backusella circina FSU 941]